MDQEDKPQGERQQTDESKNKADHGILRAKNMYRPAIAYPARAPRSIGSDDLPLGTSRGRRQRGGAGGPDHGFCGFYWLALSDGHSIRYLWPSGQPPRGLLRG